MKKNNRCKSTKVDGKRRQSMKIDRVKGHKIFRQRLVIVFQYQSVNLHRLLSIAIDYHRLSISSIDHVGSKLGLAETVNTSFLIVLLPPYESLNHIFPSCDETLSLLKVLEYLYEGDFIESVWKHSKR